MRVMLFAINDLGGLGPFSFSGGTGRRADASTPDPGRRLHPLRIARARHRAVSHPLRSDGDDAGRAVLLQRDPQGQRRERRARLGHDDRAAAEVGSRERRAGAHRRPSDRRSRDRMAEGAPGAAGPEGRRRPRPDRQDLQGCEELFPRRRHDRVRSIARHPPQRRRPAARLSPDQLQRAVAGHDDSRWARDDHVPQHQRGGGAAGHSRQAGSCLVHAEDSGDARVRRQR